MVTLCFVVTSLQATCATRPPTGPSSVKGCTSDPQGRMGTQHLFAVLSVACCCVKRAFKISGEGGPQVRGPSRVEINRDYRRNLPRYPKTTLPDNRTSLFFYPGTLPTLAFHVGFLSTRQISSREFGVPWCMLPSTSCILRGSLVTNLWSRGGRSNMSAE